MKLKLKLPSFGPAKPALPGSAEAEAYEATAEARAQAAPFASSGILKRRPEDEADDGPALKRLNSGVQAVTDAGMPPPLARPASFKFTIKKRPDAGTPTVLGQSAQPEGFNQFQGGPSTAGRPPLDKEAREQQKQQAKASDIYGGLRMVLHGRRVCLSMAQYRVPGTHTGAICSCFPVGGAAAIPGRGSGIQAASED